MQAGASEARIEAVETHATSVPVNVKAAKDRDQLVPLPDSATAVLYGAYTETWAAPVTMRFA